MHSTIRNFVCVAALPLCLPALLHADTLTAGGLLYKDVLVQPSGRLYYILIPESGMVETVRKEAVREFTPSDDPAERTRLRQQWEDSRQARNSTVTFHPPDDKAEDDARIPVPAPPPLLARFPAAADPTPEEIARRGIVERRVVHGPGKTKSLVLRGTASPDPATQTAQARFLMEKDAQEAARRAELARQEQARREQQLREQELNLRQAELQARSQAQANATRSPWVVYNAGPYYRDWSYDWPFWYSNPYPWIVTRIGPTPETPQPPQDRPDHSGRSIRSESTGVPVPPGELPSRADPETAH